MLDITRETTPRWYGLSWNEDERAIIVTARNSALIRTLSDDMSIIQGFMRQFEFSTFIENEGAGKFGFEGALETERGRDKTRFIARLPTIHKATTLTCDVCEGTGHDAFFNKKCAHCKNGVIERHGPDEEEGARAYAISASLNVLFRKLWGMGRPGDDRPQLLTLELHTDRGAYGGALSGKYSIPWVEWLKYRYTHRGHADIPRVVTTMSLAFEHMRNDEFKHSSSSFLASTNNSAGWLTMECPGSRCGLHPTASGTGLEGGYEFECHNVDTPVQQLTLLAGLAALHDMVDKDLARTTS